MKKLYILILFSLIIIYIRGAQINDILSSELSMDYDKAISQWMEYYDDNDNALKRYIAINRIYEFCKTYNVSYNKTKEFLRLKKTDYSNYFLYFLKKNKEGVVDQELLNSLNILKGFYILGPFDYNSFDEISDLVSSEKGEYIGKHFNVREEYLEFPYTKIYLDDVLGESSYSKARIRSNLFVKNSGNYYIHFSFNDGILIKIDDQIVFKKNILNTQGGFLYTLELKLSAGYHNIEIFSGVENDIWSVQFSLDKAISILKDTKLSGKSKGKLLKYGSYIPKYDMKEDTLENAVLKTLFYRYAKNFDSHERLDYTEIKQYCDKNHISWGYLMLGILETDDNDRFYWYKKLSNKYEKLSNYLLASLFDNSNTLQAGYEYMKNLSRNEEINYSIIMDYYYGMRLDKERQKYLNSLKNLSWYDSTAEKANRDIQTIKKVKDVISYLQKLGEKYPYKKLIYSNLLLQYYDDHGYTKEYVSLQEKLLKVKPYSASDFINFTDFLYKQGLMGEFIKYTDLIEKRFLYNTDLINMMVDYSLSKDDLSRAKIYAEKFLMIDPQDQKMLNIYGELSEKTNFAHEYFEKDPIDISQAPDLNDAEKNADLIVLEQNKLISESSNGRITKMVEVLYYINKYSGIDKLNYLPVYYSSSSEYVKVENVRVIHADGNIFPQYKGFSYAVGSYDKISSDFRKHYFSFDNLNIGSKVCIKYSIIQYSQKSYRDQFPGDMEFIKTSFPIKTSHLTLIYPKNKKLIFKGYNFNSFPTFTTKAGYNIYKWDFNHLDAIGYFTNMAPDVEVLPYIVISNFKSWHDVYKWAYHLFKNRFKVNKKVKDVYNSLKIKEKDTFETKVEKIFKYVSQDIHYFGVEYGLNGFQPRFPSKVISDKYGDCKDKATLMKVLLSLCGVKANITLVRTSDIGRMKPLPIITMFNHAIITVYDKKGIPYIVDPTVNYGLPWEVPNGLYKAFALEFDDNGYRIKDINNNPGQDNYERFSTKISILSASEVTFNRNIKKTGYFNFFTRSLLDMGDKANQSLENYWRNFYSKVKVNSIDF
ncbi:DUF3857 domain-containing protein, partial [bacterium]|nr:DUF3857 domain-containing protein [bacterium]